MPKNNRNGPQGNGHGRYDPDTNKMQLTKN
jgi:hypothetical protein